MWRISWLAAPRDNSDGPCKNPFRPHRTSLSRPDRELFDEDNLARVLQEVATGPADGLEVGAGHRHAVDLRRRLGRAAPCSTGVLELSRQRLAIITSRKQHEHHRP